MSAILAQAQSEPITRARVLELRKANRWEELAGLAVPASPTVEDLWLVDDVAFASGQLMRIDRAVALEETAFALEPTRRRASALAYLFYLALLAQRDLPRRDREHDRKQFTHWMQEALAREPGSVKDLYRLGVFESQIQGQRDVAAERAFSRAVESYRGLTDEQRKARHWLFKPYVKSLYGAARSALRLGRTADARRWCFACIREDKETRYVEDLDKYYLAGKVCMAGGQLDHAERAFRLALDAPGPRPRTHVFGSLAELCLQAGRHEDAAQWLERHIEPHRRDAATWRLLGDIRHARRDEAGARTAYENALRRDKGGRHLTLVRLGDLHRAAGRDGQARQAYEQAAAFRRRRYLSEDRPALTGLLFLAEKAGNPGEIAKLKEQMRKLPPLRGQR